MTRRHRRPILPPLREYDSQRDQRLPFHPLGRGRRTAGFGRHPFSEDASVLIPYLPWGTIGGEALSETQTSLTAYRAAFPDPQDESPLCLDARTLVRAQLAATFGIALRRQLIEDHLLLPGIVFARAVEELQEDEFVVAWTDAEVLPPPWATWGNGNTGSGWGWGSEDGPWGPGAWGEADIGDGWGGAQN
ncbi:hypothetical protein R3P38DRAFT_3171223 [Favolaschia claudopus]|uniref:Uncharacterized protein n=1 Tax=Favolaschia claudopus TaxID=2862362 RepID=A0AAW0DMC0_9AGAR